MIYTISWHMPLDSIQAGPTLVDVEDIPSTLPDEAPMLIDTLAVKPLRVRTPWNPAMDGILRSISGVIREWEVNPDCPKAEVLDLIASWVEEAQVYGD